MIFFGEKHEMYHCGEIITENDVTVWIMDAKTNSNPDTDPLSQLGTKVARKRKDELHLSQDELLERMRQTRYRPDVSRQSHISNIENSDGEKLPSIRVLAALALGMAEVPVIELAHLTAAQRRAYILADNALAQQSGWDEGLLKLELGALKLDGFDLSLVGFSDLQLTGFLADRTDGLTDPDEVPEPAAEVVSKTGDVWLLGAVVICPHCGVTQPITLAEDE